MKVNVFEGARRVALLVGVVWIAGWFIAGIVAGKPDIAATYSKRWPTAPFVKQDSANCKEDAATSFATKTTKAGTEIFVTLCFDPMLMTDGTPAIPYSSPKPDGSVMANTSYSTEVRNYVQEAASAFVIPEADGVNLDSLYWPQTFKVWKEGGKIALLGLGILALFTVAVGWIVRGFLGIPTGEDFRPKPPSTDESSHGI